MIKIKCSKKRSCNIDCEGIIYYTKERIENGNIPMDSYYAKVIQQSTADSPTGENHICDIAHAMTQRNRIARAMGGVEERIITLKQSVDRKK